MEIPYLHELLETLVRLPVLWVLGAGMVFGLGATQFLKLGWLAFGNTQAVTERRFTFSIRAFSAGATWLFSLGIWHSVLSHGGLEEWICAGWGIASPIVYDSLRALVAWQFPGFASHWGGPDTVNFKGDSNGPSGRH